MANNDTDEVKKQILRTLYYDEATGFQSTANLYKEARGQNNNITTDYVKKWLANQSIIQTQKVNKSQYNSYVADHPLQQVAIDLADYSKSKAHNDGYQYIFVAVDYFSKYIVAYPMKSKQGSDLTIALKSLIHDMEKVAKAKIETIVSDQEGGTNTTPFIRVLNENNIRHIITGLSNGMVERAIKTIKDLIHNRITGLNLEEERWIDLLPKVVNFYNTKHIHRTIKMSPISALNGQNKVEVHLNIRNQAQFNKTYPKLQVDDLVRTAIKKKTISKGHHPNFSKETYKVLHVSVMADGTRQYMLANHPNKKPWYRWELRRVEVVETKYTV
jgi:hypothetical protein